jgi:hypothetical protein
MMAWGITIHKSQGLTLEKVVVELGEKEFSVGLSFVAISQVKTLQFHTHFDHAHLKKPKETDSMFMLNRDNEHHNWLEFRLNTYGMDLSEYTFIDYYYFVIYAIIIFSMKISESCSAKFYNRPLAAKSIIGGQ